MPYPVPTPCSVFDQCLSNVSESLDALRTSILWPDGKPICDPGGHVNITFEQMERLFANMQNLLTYLHSAEVERVRKIMEQI